MAATTYRKLADIIIDRHYNSIPSDDATISVRQVAELAATAAAWFAGKSAFENSNAGEATYANDQFVITVNNLPLLVDEVTGEKYTMLTSSPAGLPNNQEVVAVNFTKCPTVRVVPLKLKDAFAQQYLKGPSGIVNYTLQGLKLVFTNVGKLVEGPISVKQVCGLDGADLLSSTISVPKNVEADIIDKVLLWLDPRRGERVDMLNDSSPIVRN